MLLPLVLVICMLNGLASPWLPVLWGTSPLWMAGMMPDSISAITYISSLALSTVTLMVSGVPAALYERYTHAQESTTASLSIWLAAAALMSWPALPNVLKMAG
jgi:hypothetical protein